MAPREPLPVPVLRCSHCNGLAAAPRQLCPRCHGASLLPVDARGAGTLVSFTVIRRAPLRFSEDAPYAVCVVDLDCEVRCTGRLANLDEVPALGERVRCTARDGAIATFGRDA